MVVTRKVPTAPAPPVSRTASSQQASRIAKGKAPQTIPNAQGVSGTDVSVSGASSGPNGASDGLGNLNDVDSSPQKRKSKSKKDKKKSLKRGATFWDFLIRLLTIAFIVYTIQVCPNDPNHESSICYGLAKYRELVLDRYLFPAFHRVLVHPSVVPYVERVKPPIDFAIRLGQPIVQRTQKEWNLRVIPQWNRRVVPQWHKHVVPQWNKHVVPKLAFVDQKIEPYRTRVSAQFNRYLSRIAPHFRLAIYNLHRWQRHAQPYIIIIATKTHDGYQTAKPHVIPLWNRVKAGLNQLLLFVREQRVLFVDPHVARIWEKVKELSSGNSIDNGTLKEPATSVTRKENTTEATSATTAAIRSASFVHPEVFESTLPSPTIASSLSEEVTPTPDITGPTIIAAEPMLTVLNGEDDYDLDLDDLARELGLDDSASPQVAETIVPPPEQTESEEEKAERLRKRLEETAEKRADIMNRFSKWEADLRDLIKTRKKSLRKALVTMRKAAAVELKEDKEVRDAIKDLTTEAEKYLKRAGAYMRALKKEGKADAVKVDLWDKVIERVDGKFSDQLEHTEHVLEVWHMNFLDQETQEVRKVVEDVGHLSEKAQADLGLDLAWLDDVTYADWQRYHDLARSSENFTELAASIQNGTHHSPPIDPIPSVLAEFASEINEIADDFEIRLRQLKHDGRFAFGERVDDGDDTMLTSPPEFSILPVPDEAEKHGATKGIPPVFIGRSKEEVVDALGRADKEGTETLSLHSAEEDKSVVDAARSASTEASQTVPVHIEL